MASHRRQSMPPNVLTHRRLANLEQFWQAARRLFRERLPNRRLSLRLLGVGVSGLTAAAAQSTAAQSWDGTTARSFD
jgi:hypothetical protein